MLKALTEMFAGLRSDNAAEEDSADHQLKLATAVLLVEIARADYAFDEVEQEAIVNLLSVHLTLSDAEIQTLIELAAREADDVAHLQGFTRRLNEELDYDGKLRIVEMLWLVAFADNELSKFEDSLVRKLADLLYVSHSDQIRLRNAVQEQD